MKIKLIAIGKIKHKSIAELAQEYHDRIKKFHPFELIEIHDESIRNPKEISIALEKEAKQIETHLKKNSYLILLEEKGEEWTSVELAWELGQLFQSPHSEIIFLIGGAYGIADSLRKKSPTNWSLSKLTLPHQLARVLVLEQLYRAFTILRNVPYHHS
jgi:23S rRNA (pseudouridine1915-N3)-methyltransferase